MRGVFLMSALERYLPRRKGVRIFINRSIALFMRFCDVIDSCGGIALGVAQGLPRGSSGG